MDEQPVVTKAGCSPVQGCLIGAVVLFVILLLVSIVLGYRQFRKHTADPVPAAALDVTHLPDWAFGVAFLPGPSDRSGAT